MVVAIISVCGYVLPSEVFLLQWFHGIRGLHLYSEQGEREREREGGGEKKGDNQDVILPQLCVKCAYLLEF